jgi:hydrogenase expression/formation protein HypD
MKHLDEYRDAETARRLAASIKREAATARRYRLMEFCGGHTHAIFRYGLEDLLPANIEMVHGPGCPVCVLPTGRLDMAIRLAKRDGVILACYGDMLRVPGSQGQSLMKAKADGADIRMVYSTLDAVKLAQANPDREVIFFAIGFETTTPPTALAIEAAAKKGLTNFSVFCNHVLTPSAIAAILEAPAVRELGVVEIDGFLGPAHVSVVIGSQPYEFFAAEYRKPVAISGFEPIDILQSILMLVRQLNEGRAEVENQYIRAVTRDGNLRAKQAVSRIFELRRDFEWRGLGTSPIRRYASRMPSRRSTPSAASTSPISRARATRPAPARQSCAAPRSRPTAGCSAAPARRIRRSAPAWSPRKAPAPLITVTAGCGSGCNEHRPPCTAFGFAPA